MGLCKPLCVCAESSKAWSSELEVSFELELSLDDLELSADEDDFFFFFFLSFLSDLALFFFFFEVFFFLRGRSSFSFSLPSSPLSAALNKEVATSSTVFSSPSRSHMRNCLVAWARKGKTWDNMGNNKIGESRYFPKRNQIFYGWYPGIPPNSHSKWVSTDYFHSTTHALKLQKTMWVRECVCVSQQTPTAHSLEWNVVCFPCTILYDVFLMIEQVWEVTPSTPDLRDPSSVSKPCRSGFFLTCVSLTCSSKSIFAEIIWRTTSWSPNFWSISALVIHLRHPKVRLRLCCESWMKKSDCLHTPAHEVHCSMSICSLSVSLYAAAPAARISGGVFLPQPCWEFDHDDGMPAVCLKWLTYNQYNNG